MWLQDAHPRKRSKDKPIPVILCQNVVSFISYVIWCSFRIYIPVSLVADVPSGVLWLAAVVAMVCQRRLFHSVVVSLSQALQPAMATRLHTPLIIWRTKWVSVAARQWYKALFGSCSAIRNQHCCSVFHVCYLFVWIKISDCVSGYMN